MQDLLEVAAALAERQHAAGRAFPSPLELALFMRDFEREVRAPYLPAALVRAITAPLAWLTRRCGLDARYRLLHGPASRDRTRREADASGTGPVPPAAR